MTDATIFLTEAVADSDGPASDGRGEAGRALALIALGLGTFLLWLALTWWARTDRVSRHEWDAHRAERARALDEHLERRRVAWAALRRLWVVLVGLFVWVMVTY